MSSLSLFKDRATAGAASAGEYEDIARQGKALEHDILSLHASLTRFADLSPRPDVNEIFEALVMRCCQVIDANVVKRVSTHVFGLPATGSSL